MTQQDNIVGAASVPTQQTDLHRAVAELQQAIGELQHAAHAPGTTGPAPTGVLIGAGSDPLMLGLPAFVVGWTCVGLALVGVVPAAAVGGVVPVLLLGTAVFQFISAVWAFLLGQSLVAAIFGLFSGIASSLSILLLGVFHNWFAIPAADLSGVEALFTISWAIVFVFLTWIMLKLPAVYGAIMIFVEAALCLLSAAYLTGNANLVTAGGAAVLAFTVLGAYAWLNVASEASGGPAWPPLGPPVRK
ncbi:MAG TPA: GPR1/FUN34/YaaH family transporter [Trebonia sp.]|jgi:succinate-acetate transporter protein|nr:GPR1/FUN34/YaaH family transporter [Trebonia sp.]